MSKFNVNIQPKKTVNFAGGEAFKQDSKLAYVSLLLTSFVKDQYYRSEDETLTEVSSLIDSISDKKFVAKAAIYARTKFGMRSISHVIAAEIAQKVKGEKWTKDFFDKIIYRPDDMGEILAYYYSKGNKNEPNALKKGFARAFSRFDAYKLAKYRKEGATVSLVDVVNLVHPKNTEAIAQLVKGTLPTPDTWETKLSATKGDEELKSGVWKELITTKKIGYFALLRNLRNILEQSPEIVPAAAELLVNEQMIKSSLVLPFRYLSAIGEIQKLSGVDQKNIRLVIQALNKACDIALQNVPIFDGNTLVVLDTSSSMRSGENTKSPAEIGSLFAAVLVKSNNADFMSFAEDAHYFNTNTADSILSITQGLINASNGGGTNFRSIFETANKAYDRVIILSDMQGWMGYNSPTDTFNAYKARLSANPKIYSFDLAGYGSMQFPENNIFCIAGFSDKILDVMKLFEQDKNALISEIENVEL